MNNCIFHAFLIPLKDNFAVLHLTNKYKIATDLRESQNPIFLVTTAGSEDTVKRSKIPHVVDSITVVYGINGGGKTRFLLDVCNTITHRHGNRPLGILWESSGQLYFDPGNHLRRARVIGDKQIKIAFLPDKNVKCGAVFYTTSPFETVRRKLAFKDSETLDATPGFSNDTPFGGLQLFQAAKALPPDLVFLKEMEVQAKLKIPSLRSLIEEYTSIRRDKFSPSEVRYIELDHEERTQLKRLPKELNDFLRDALAIEMHQAYLEGKEVASRLLSDLRELIWASDTNSAVENLLKTQGHLRQFSSISICSAIQRAKTSAKFRFSARGRFIEYVDEIAGWDDETMQGLQQAEKLALLKWSFLKLSSGQVAMLMLFASLAGALNEHARRRTRRLMLAVDEGEMFMHPEWQRAFLSQLVNFLQFYRSQFESIHLMVSTHSLIVAGDAPPNRLFDIVSGRMHNGFAAPPDELLKTVYHVPEFSGELAEKLFTKISTYLKSGGDIEEAEEVQFLVSQIASPRLRKYLEEAVIRRMELQDD